MKGILKYIESWSQFKWFLIIFSGTVVIVVPTAIVGAKMYVKYKLEQNTKEVTTEQTLKELKKGQENLNGSFVAFQDSLWALRGDFNTFKTQENGKITELTKSVNNVDQNLNYYVKHSGDMTTQQILEAFELGREDQKKKIAWKFYNEPSGSGGITETENMIFTSTQ